MKRLTLLLTLLMLALAVVPAFAQQRDGDGDGLSNSEDACPFKAGPRENNGCPLQIDDLASNPPAPETPAPDTDGDGLPDSDDQCPTVSGSRENRGCPDTSLVTPAAPALPESAPVNPDPPTNPNGVTANPVSDVDTDGDGTPDSGDSCPNAAGPRENRGCPPDTAAPDTVTASEPPPFAPPALPTSGCHVTSARGYEINVRKMPNTSAEVIGSLKSGVVYAAEGYVLNGTEVWLVLSSYEGGSGTGYASQSVLLASNCAEMTVAVDGASAHPGGVNFAFGDGSVRTVRSTTDDSENPTMEYCILQEVGEAGVFQEVCYEVEVPEGCVVTSAEAGVFTVDCGAGPVSLNPLFEDVPAEGLQVPVQGTHGSTHGVTVLAWAKASDSDQAQSTAEYCVTQETQEAGVFQEVCYEVDVPEGCWLSSVEAGVFITQCRPDIGAAGVWLVGDTAPTAQMQNNLRQIGIAHHTFDAPIDPLDLTIMPPVMSGGRPMETLSLNFTKITYTYPPQNTSSVELDFRDTTFRDPQPHDDGSTTVEYCISVELYEVGVFNTVCYEVEVPANCELISTEAGVYTIVCEEGGVISVNPDVEDLPALDMTIPSREQSAIYIKYDGIKANTGTGTQDVLIGLLPAVQK